MPSNDPATAKAVRHVLWFIGVGIVVLTLVLAGRLGVAIYEQAHPRNISVWCDGGGVNRDGDTYFNRLYEGPADKVLGACQMVAGTNAP